MNDLPCAAAVDRDGVRRAKTEIRVGNTVIGRDFLVIAGPCSVESEEQMLAAACAVASSGAQMLRGGAFKPRTSPYTFQGLGREGLVYLRRAGDAVGLPVITEAVDPRQVDLVAEYADVVQIGARNMQNYPLLTEAGHLRKPVLLKRSMYATLSEWLHSAEYILSHGNPQVILCERGVHSFETYTRNTLDLSAVCALGERTHLPVVVDPSHATGRSEMVAPMALAAVMAGCDGLEIEVHPEPSHALSDAEQQLTPDAFAALMDDVRKVLACRRSLSK